MLSPPTLQARAIERIPTEIWIDIFHRMVGISIIDEFGLNGAAYVLVDRHSQPNVGSIMPVKESHAFRSRLIITKVCKHWYRIGIQALWSHIRIQLNNTEFRALNEIRNAIKRDSALASFVIRCSLLAALETTFNEILMSEIRLLIQNFSYLKILYCPQEYTIASPLSSLEVAVVAPGFGSYRGGMLIVTRPSFQNARTLVINFNGLSGLKLECHPISFLRLENLRIQVTDTMIADCVIRYWKVPNLRIVSITSHVTSPWLDFLETWNKELCIMELSLEDHDWPREISLPVLREALFSAKQYTHWMLNAPRLERFGLFEIDASKHSNIRENLTYTVEQVQKTFMSLRRIRLIGHEGVPFVAPAEPNGLQEEDIESWQLSGIETEIVSSEQPGHSLVPYRSEDWL